MQWASKEAVLPKAAVAERAAGQAWTAAAQERAAAEED
jgi:hypothetical protein